MKQLALIAVCMVCIFTSPAFAMPALSVVGGGIHAGNWVWDVSVTPDLTLAGGSTPVALELGFRLTGSPLMSATLLSPSVFDTPNPGAVIFGWETLTPAANNRPEGLQANLPTSEVFSAFGTIDISTAGASPFLRIVAKGPANGGSTSSAIQWLGAYAGKGRIAQITTAPPGSANFDLFSGTSSQMVVAIPGDFNSDGRVDAADFSTWRTGFGTASGATLSSGDANGDADVDGGDFLVWQQNFGTGASSSVSSAAVPEPASILLGACCLAGLLRRRVGCQSV